MLGRVAPALPPLRACLAPANRLTLFAQEIHDILRQTVKPDTVMVIPALPLPPPPLSASSFRPHPLSMQGALAQESHGALRSTCHAPVPPPPIPPPFSRPFLILFAQEIHDILRQTVKPDTVMVIPALPFPPPKRNSAGKVRPRPVHCTACTPRALPAPRPPAPLDGPPVAPAPSQRWQALRPSPALGSAATVGGAGPPGAGGGAVWAGPVGRRRSARAQVGPNERPGGDA